MTDGVWLLREDGSLCMDGFPIRIRRRTGSNMPFELISDWHKLSLPYHCLESAKIDAKRLAGEIAQMTPD